MGHSSTQPFDKLRAGRDDPTFCKCLISRISEFVISSPGCGMSLGVWAALCRLMPLEKRGPLKRQNVERWAKPTQVIDFPHPNAEFGVRNMDESQRKAPRTRTRRRTKQNVTAENMA